MPHRSCRRGSSPRAAGLVVPAAADLACPEIQGRTRAHRSREKRHSRHTKHEHEADHDDDSDDGDDGDDDDDTRDRPVLQPSATHIRHGTNTTVHLCGGPPTKHFRSTCTRSVTRLASPCRASYRSEDNLAFLRWAPTAPSPMFEIPQRLTRLPCFTVIATRYQSIVTISYAYTNRHNLFNTL